jgi:citrate synthase
MLWYLLTGQVPSETQIRDFSRDLAERSSLPSHITSVIDSLRQSLFPRCFPRRDVSDRVACFLQPLPSTP